MDFVKKEWKAIVLTICLLGIFVYLSHINGQLDVLKNQNAKLVSTMDSVESVTISTDGVVHDMGKKIDSIDTNLSFVVHRLRQR